MSFVSRQRVRFGDCDGAGIAYYPRLLAIVDAALEEWSEATIGLGREQTHLQMRRGTPTVELNVRFEHPCRLGEMLELAVAPTHVGRSSLTLAVDAAVAGQPRFAATVAQVCMDLDALTATPWPEAWRDAFGSAGDAMNEESDA